jgi:hypothetical protein
VINAIAAKTRNIQITESSFIGAEKEKAPMTKAAKGA